MTINANLTTFHGLPVVDFSFKTGLADPTGTAYRLELGEEGETERPSLLGALEGVDDDADDLEQYGLVVERLAADPNASQLRALVIGEWIEPWEMDADPILDALIAHKNRFPKLEAVFVGDMSYDQCDVSMMQAPEKLADLLGAFPALRRLACRGADGPTLRAGLAHDGLVALTVQSGGLSHTTVDRVCGARLPHLEELELWIGTANYGRTVEVATITPLLSGKLFPKLRRLGLMNAEIADDLAHAVASSPLLNQLEELDLSYGTLSDAGAEALLAAPGVATLKRLDLTHHYCSPAMVERLEALPAEVTADDAQTGGDDDRYVMVGE